MADRLRFRKVAPDLYASVLQMYEVVSAHVDPTLKELVNLRASTLNGCEFCIQLHSSDALAAGETPARLFGLAAWWKTTLYTPAERAALALTDAVTRLGEEGVSDAVWAGAAAHFDDEALAHLLGAILVINTFNRLGIATHPDPA